MESNLTNFSLPLTFGLDSTTNEPVSIDLGKCGNILLAGSTKHRYEAIIKILDIGPELNIFTIISTQSSDKDILTKKLLENCRTRIAFRTITRQDSKRIINKSGAENLLGRVEAILYQEGNCRKIQCP